MLRRFASLMKASLFLLSASASTSSTMSSVIGCPGGSISTSMSTAHLAVEFYEVRPTGS